MAVIGMGREAEGLGILDRAFDDLHQTRGSDRAHHLGVRHLLDHVLEILTSPYAPEGVLHSKAEHIHEKNGEAELSIRSLPCDGQVTDPLVPKLGPRKSPDD